MMKLSTTRAGDACVIAVLGELDRFGAEPLMSAIESDDAARAGRLVLDLTAMTFMDSTGLGALLFAWTRAQDRGAQLVVVVPLDAHARRTIELRGVTERLHVVPTRDAALAL